MQAETEEILVTGEVLVDLLKATLGRGVSLSFRARGSSMSPFIRDGDTITVSPLSRTPGIGAVLAYQCPSTRRLVIHRMVGKVGDSYLIKADNSVEPTEIVPGGNIFGRVTRLQRRGKKVFSGLGPERFMISIFSRSGCLRPLMRFARYIRSLGASLS